MVLLDTSPPGWTYVLAAAGLISAALLAAVASVLVVWLPMRNERGIANQEADLLKKLDRASAAANDLQRLLDARVARWTHKAFKRDTTTDREITSTSDVWLYRMVFGGLVLIVILAVILLFLNHLSSPI